MSELQSLITEAQAQIAATEDPAAWIKCASISSAKGLLTAQLKSLGALSAEERPAAGAKINEAKEAISEALNARKEVLEQAQINAQLAAEALDISLPGRNNSLGACIQSAAPSCA